MFTRGMNRSWDQSMLSVMILKYVHARVEQILGSVHAECDDLKVCSYKKEQILISFHSNNCLSAWTKFKFKSTTFRIKEQRSGSKLNNFKDEHWHEEFVVFLYLLRHKGEFENSKKCSEITKISWIHHKKIVLWVPFPLSDQRATAL